MKVLHICAYYIGNSLYKSLISELSRKSLDQSVYIPIRKKEHLDKNIITDNKDITFHYSNILNISDRLFYSKKIEKLFKDIERKIIHCENFDIIHAYTLFSDGGIAYKLKEKYKVPYIVTIQNTDINYFLKYGIHLRKTMLQILLEAEFIVFMSPAYQEIITKNIPAELRGKIVKKYKVIPNGIDNYWHLTNNNLSVRNKPNKNIVKLVQVSRIDNNKNIKASIQVVKELNLKGIKASLSIIGKGPLEQKMRKFVKKINLTESIKFLGQIESKKELKNILLGSDIFIMPSKRETFGLAYIEAMAVGLPVIYSKGQGIDGLFVEGSVGYAVENNPIEITEMVLKILKDYEILSKNSARYIKDFNWDKVSDAYIDLYENIKNE
jgi:L-malate glycosyltransferase